jgi:hypothetical protein
LRGGEGVGEIEDDHFVSLELFDNLLRQMR